MRDLEKMKLVELRQMAKDLGVKGWWNLNKTKAIEAIKNSSEEVEAPEQANTNKVEENIPEAQESAPKKNQKRLITYNGKTQTLTTWAKELGMRHQTLYNRIVMKGWDVERAFEKNPKSQKITYNIYDSFDTEFKHGFMVQVADRKGSRKAAERKALNSGMCVFYGINKPKAYLPEEVDEILNGDTSN